MTSTGIYQEARLFQSLIGNVQLITSLISIDKNGKCFNPL